MEGSVTECGGVCSVIQTVGFSFCAKLRLLTSSEITNLLSFSFDLYMSIYINGIIILQQKEWFLWRMLIMPYYFVILLPF